MLDPNGRVIMLSGASRGIGRAIARCLHDKGYSLSLGTRDPETLKEALGGSGDERLLCCSYVSEDRATHESWLVETLDRFGRLDGLINNAGGTVNFTIEEGEEAA